MPVVAQVEYNDSLPLDAPVVMAVLPARRNCAAAAVLAEQNGSLGAGWPALAVSSARQRAGWSCPDSRADLVVLSAALLGMDSAGCRLNCNSATMAAPACPAHSDCPVTENVRRALPPRCGPANRECRHEEQPAAANGRCGYCCLAAGMGFRLPVAKTAAGPASAPLADCGVEAVHCRFHDCLAADLDCQSPAQPAQADCGAVVNCCYHFHYEVADMGFPPSAKAARRAATRPGRMDADYQRSADGSRSASGHRVRVVRRARRDRLLHGWQSGESASASPG